MAKNMKTYYLSRIVISAALGFLLFATGSTLWMSLLISGLILVFFIWAPLSGRYSVHPEFGVTALRRDDRTQAINDKAARNAFVASMLTIAASILYFGFGGGINIPIVVLKIVLGIGILTYYVSDLWLRRV